MFNYKATRWLKKRERILRRDEYMCREAKRYGKTEQATTVHHIYPVEFHPELAYEDWNLLSLSNKWHNAMHDRETHELTELGKQWQERVRPQYKRWNEDDEQVNTMYFTRIVEATKAFEDGDKTHDNVHMYQLLRCSETRRGEA